MEQQSPDISPIVICARINKLAIAKQHQSVPELRIHPWNDHPLNDLIHASYMF
jgi:hypothetical protein